MLSLSDAFAAEGTGAGRKLWDSIMLFVNFGILVFLFIKFARKPLMDFLYGERKKIAARLNEMEKQVKEAKALMETEAEKLKSIDIRISEIRERVISLGQKEKDSIIEKAQTTAKQMIEDAKNETEYKLEAAKKRFGEEMLEIAVSIAKENLKKSITSEEDERIINTFSDDLSAEKIHFA